MTKVIWTEPAVADLQAIVDYISRDSETFAIAFAQNKRENGDIKRKWGHPLKESPPVNLCVRGQIFSSLSRYWLTVMVSILFWARYSAFLTLLFLYL